MLSVDYRRCERYPSAIQDVLDAYLTITGFSYNGSQRQDCVARATKVLGFLPRRVLLLGDSCGGSLIMSLLCLLNEMRRQWPDPTSAPLMPFAICPVYPVFDLRGVVSPSRLLGSFDPILHNGNLLAMHGCYGGMQTGKFHRIWSIEQLIDWLENMSCRILGNELINLRRSLPPSLSTRPNVLIDKLE